MVKSDRKSGYVCHTERLYRPIKAVKAHMKRVCPSLHSADDDNSLVYVSTVRGHLATAQGKQASELYDVYFSERSHEFSCITVSKHGAMFTPMVHTTREDMEAFSPETMQIYNRFVTSGRIDLTRQTNPMLVRNLDSEAPVMNVSPVMGECDRDTNKREDAMQYYHITIAVAEAEPQQVWVLAKNESAAWAIGLHKLGIDPSTPGIEIRAQCPGFTTFTPPAPSDD